MCSGEAGGQRGGGVKVGFELGVGLPIVYLMLSHLTCLPQGRVEEIGEGTSSRVDSDGFLSKIHLTSCPQPSASSKTKVRWWWWGS